MRRYPRWERVAITVVAALALSACGDGGGDEAGTFGVAGGFVAGVPAGWTVVAPQPLGADSREPGSAGQQPLIAAFSPAEAGAGVAVFIDQSGDSVSDVAEAWRDRFAADLGEWSEETTRGLTIRSTKPAENNGPGPGGFLSVHVVKVDGEDESWVLQCTGPDEESARCAGVMDTIVPS